MVSEALQILSGIKSPVYGVPGNHDYWSKAPFDEFAKTFKATGGAWLLDEQRVTADGKFSVLGATCRTAWPCRRGRGSTPGRGRGRPRRTGSLWRAW